MCKLKSEAPIEIKLINRATHLPRPRLSNTEKNTRLLCRQEHADDDAINQWYWYT